MAGTLYVKLDASYADDPKIIEAGERAEVLYLRSLCLVKRILSDGFVADAHLPRFGLSQVNQRARKLTEVGLWDRDDQMGGYWIRGWGKHNKLSTEIRATRSEASEAGTLGNHRRWHEGRSESDPDCPHCSHPDGEPESGTRSPPRSQASDRTRSPEPEPEPEPEPSGVGEATPSKRPRDETFEALVDVCGLILDELTKTERGRCNKAAKELREVGATPDGIRARAQVYRERWPTADLTPQALTANYSLLGTAPPQRNGQASRGDNGYDDANPGPGPEPGTLRGYM